MGIGQRAIGNKQRVIGNEQSIFAYCILHIANSITYRKLLIASCLLLITNYSNAQDKITLQQAIEIALANNLAFKNEKLRTEYHQKLIKSGATIPATNIGGQYGQINSVYNDLSLGISQTINFPTVYSRQKDLLSEEWKSSVLNLKLKEAELKKLVTETYFTLLYIQQKKKLLVENDSLFTEFLNKSILRFQKGETNVLEKTTAEHQRGQIAVQLSQLEEDSDILQMQFQYLLNTTTVFSADENEVVPSDVLLIEKPEFVGHPLTQYWKQQQAIAIANTKVEKSRLLPDINFGYNIMGMKGLGENNIEYNSDLRFQSVQIGLGIPVFNGSQKSKINASKINEQITANEYEIRLRNLEMNFAQAVKRYQKNQNTVLYFKNMALKNSETIKTIAAKQFLNGEINYLDWVLLMSQAISIQSDYLDALRNRNNAIAEINFYFNK